MAPTERQISKDEADKLANSGSDLRREELGVESRATLPPGPMVTGGTTTAGFSRNSNAAQALKAYGASAQLSRQGIQEEAAAKQDRALQTSETLDKAILFQDADPEIARAHQASLQSQREYDIHFQRAQDKQLEAELAQVNPKEYMQQLNPAASVASALSVMAGAFVNGLSGGKIENVGLKMLDQSIEQNIAAQRDNMNQKWRAAEGAKNMFQLAAQRLGDARKAEEFMKRVYWDNVDRSIKAIEHSTQSPIIAAQSKQLQAGVAEKLGEAYIKTGTTQSNSNTKAWSNVPQGASAYGVTDPKTGQPLKAPGNDQGNFMQTAQGKLAQLYKFKQLLHAASRYNLIDNVIPNSLSQELQGMAYNIAVANAKVMDPGGRLSDFDVQAQIKAGMSASAWARLLNQDGLERRLNNAIKDHEQDVNRYLRNQKSAGTNVIPQFDDWQSFRKQQEKVDDALLSVNDKKEFVKLLKEIGAPTQSNIQDSTPTGNE